MGMMWHIRPISSLDAVFLELLQKEGISHLPDGEGSRYPTPNEIRQVLDSLEDCNISYGVNKISGMKYLYSKHQDRWDYFDVEPEWVAVIKKLDNSQTAQIEGVDFMGDEDKPLHFYFDRGSGELALNITEKLSAICGPFIFCTDTWSIVVTPGIDIHQAFQTSYFEGEDLDIPF